MANRKLGKFAIEEIREEIARCVAPAEISREAQRLAAQFGVSKNRIYELTADLRDKRQPRRDKGSRSADLMGDPVLKQVASWCVAYDITPTDAFLLAKTRGLVVPVTLSTFVRYMREHDLDKTYRHRPVTPHRRFEASAPGEIFQFDISGSKQRWFDIKTRRIQTVSVLDVSENHPNENPNRVKIWRFKLIDDYSRMVFTRYYAVDKHTGRHVVDFLLQAFAVMGVPLKLYCDNDRTIKAGRNAAAARILARALANLGGYKLEHHEPGNARATGKIERQHQESEKTEKLIGLFLAEGRELTVEQMQIFATNKDTQYNDTRHRTTGESPNARWHSKLHLVRKLDYKVLKSAFLADEFEITLKGNLSFELRGKSYQLPHDQMFENLLAQQSRSKRKFKVIFADDADFYTLIDHAGNEYDIPKIIATPDIAGEYKSFSETRGERHRKTLIKHAQESARAEKSRRQNESTMPTPIPYFDNDITAEINARQAAENAGIIQFPTPGIDVTPHIVEALPAAQKALAESVASTTGQRISFWDAARKFQSHFPTLADCKQFLITVFADRDTAEDEAMIRQAIEIEIGRRGEGETGKKVDKKIDRQSDSDRLRSIG